MRKINVVLRYGFKYQNCLAHKQKLDVLKDSMEFLLDVTADRSVVRESLKGKYSLIRSRKKSIKLTCIRYSVDHFFSQTLWTSSSWYE